MKDLRLKFKGIDDWNRPVFMDDNGRYLVIQTIYLIIQLVKMMSLISTGICH